MKRGRVILLSASVVAIGTIIALQFHKPDGPKADSADWSSPSSATAGAGVNPSSPLTARGQGSSLVGGIESPAGAKLSSSMSSALAELDQKVFLLEDESSPADSTAVAQNSTLSPALQPLAAGPLVELNCGPRSHRIADGDTLVRLAERYLGSADRSMEIFEYNRDVLRSPDMLPIGSDLRIPPQIPVKSVETNAAANTVAAQSPLVPLDRALPAATAATTSARSSSDNGSKQRTYEVKVGDSL
ncbi:MAG: LysM peptidoglycan-binding domain-containing protein, partial [Pirellulales bacterium]|nr:LysM peptidoglycan-binding domain-containing protein [Pirellulales bacterium]